MRRRAFIAAVGGSAATWPHFARAQKAANVRRIGFLRVGPPPAAFAAQYVHDPRLRHGIWALSCRP